jgi:hypothetical protein
MKMQDDRTNEEKKTHAWIVAGTDRFMSGWGEARGGVSYAGWACKYEDLNKVESWVENRSDMKRVRVVGNDWRPKGVGHTHIYVVHENHNALQ